MLREQKITLLREHRSMKISLGTSMREHYLENNIKGTLLGEQKSGTFIWGTLLKGHSCRKMIGGTSDICKKNIIE